VVIATKRRALLLCCIAVTAIVSAGAALLFDLPQRNVANAATASCAAEPAPADDADAHAGMVFIPGGAFTMGADDQRPEERLAHRVRVDGFWIDRHEVTNAQFAAFVEATGYVTLAERGVDPATHPGMPAELLAPGSIVFIPPTDLGGGDITQWWQYVQGADWREPEGPGSSIEGRENHPVVHVAYEDALAYARWRDRDLPTEAQWEYAARGGLEGEDYAWGSDYQPGGRLKANSWQGIFPVLNTEEDGYVGTAPVGCFDANGYGLYDMIGNAWEWTNDWYRDGHAAEETINPTGPNLLEIGFAPGESPRRVIKGGSHLCAPNFCARYRPAARQPQEVDLGAAHLGFRTVLNAPGP
jgi:formylglycine-generating enzyme required for sulfatase activity